MSSLWGVVFERKNNLEKKGPSPKHIHSILCHKSDSQSGIPDKIPYTNAEQFSAKRISLFASRRGLPAGMSVEAGIVLPLFLFFFFQLGNAIECIRLHSNMEFALWDVGREIALYSTPLQGQQTGQLLQGIGEILFTNTYMKERLTRFGGDDLLEEVPITGGRDGIVFLVSEILPEDDIVQLSMSYQVKPMGVLPGFYMRNQYYAHGWNGYDIPKEAKAGVVFVTEYGEVYHEKRDCMHLNIEIKETTTELVKKLRNAGGAKYKACSRCVDGGMKSDRLYITEDGNRYHCDRNCSGLKRTVYIVLRQDATQYRRCRRCAGY